MLNLDGHISDDFHQKSAAICPRWVGSEQRSSAGARIDCNRCGRLSQSERATCLTLAWRMLPNLPLSLSLYDEAAQRDHLQQAFGPAAIRAVSSFLLDEKRRQPPWISHSNPPTMVPLFLIMFFAELCFWRRPARTRTLTSQFSTFYPVTTREICMKEL
jgi:hypothetical protein